VAPLRPLGGATGWELGLRSEPAKGMQTSLSLWGLRAASELVYLGDAGATEVQSASRRRGIELSQRVLPSPQWTLDADLAFSRARLDGGAFVPNAVQRMAALGLAWRPKSGMQWSLQARHIGPAPLTEDGSVHSRASTLFTLRGSHAFSARLQATLDVFNLLDRQVDDIQYHYASRLPAEPQAVEDRHVHPAEPRRLRLSLRYAF
jgi:outer membrane receptor protein involved in Fe transport